MSIEFIEQQGAYVGTGEGGRKWRITRVFAGWRMEFRDVGDPAPTNAGLHATIEAAKAEASR